MGSRLENDSNHLAVSNLCDEIFQPSSQSTLEDPRGYSFPSLRLCDQYLLNAAEVYPELCLGSTYRRVRCNPETTPS
jgi:hypothetical protein